jgi:hypothetical protein
MKTIYIIALFSLCSCNRNEGVPQNRTEQSGVQVTNGSVPLSPSEQSRMQVRDDTSKITQGSDFENQDQSYAKVSLKESVTTRIRNVSYSEQYLDRDTSLDYYIMKETRETESIRGVEGLDSRITLDIYTISESKLVRTIKKQADEVRIWQNLGPDFLQVMQYGDLLKYCELSEIWRDNTFLTFNDKFYVVSIADPRMQFYMGYSLADRDEPQLIHGALHFTHYHARLLPGARSYSDEYRVISRVFFKAKSREVYEKLTPWCPSITLLRHTDKDEIVDTPEYQELRLWSFNHHVGLNGINFDALRLTFQDDTTITVTIPVENGLLFGDNSLERILYVGQ